MIIKNKVQVARKEHKCDSCKRTILKKEQYRYFFGAPDIGDKPYSLRCCQDCDVNKEGYKQESERFLWVAANEKD